METIFTEHARGRLIQRNIKEKEVMQVLKNPDRISKSFGGRKIAQKRFKGKNLEVIYKEEQDRLVVITNYWLEE